MNHTASKVTADPERKRIFSYLDLKALTPYGFLLPFLIIFSVFGIFPLLFSIFLSFHEWNPVEGLGAMDYVGVENYHIALTDPWLWRSLKNTLWLAITSGVAQHLVALPVAYILVSLGDRFRHWLTSAYFLPFITSTVAASLYLLQHVLAKFGHHQPKLDGTGRQHLVWLGILLGERLPANPLVR